MKEDPTMKFKNFIPLILVVTLLGGFLVYYYAAPRPVTTEVCEVYEEPKTTSGRRSINHVMETSCGKLSMDVDKKVLFSTTVEVGEEYEMVLEHLPGGAKKVIEITSP